MKKGILLTSFMVLIMNLVYSQSFSKKLSNNPKITSENNENSGARVIPVDSPWPYFGKFPFLNSSNTISVDKNIENLTHDITLLKSMCAWEEKVTVVDLTQNASIKFAFINASENGESYRVIYTFKKYTIVDSALFRYQVGIEVRLTAEFKTLKGNLNLTLSSIGASGSAGKLNGTISLQCYGASLSKIGSAFTTTSSITSESIEKVLQQVSTLKSMIYESDATIQPYVIAFEKLQSDSSDSNMNWFKLQENFKANTKSGMNIR
jgi:hypothetical protein